MTTINPPPKLVSLFTTTLAQSIGDSDTETITLTNTARLIQGQQVTLTIDRVDANGDATLDAREVFQGTISGNNLINYTRGYDDTQAQAHNSGAIVEIILVAADYNKVVDSLNTLVEVCDPENLVSSVSGNQLRIEEDDKLYVPEVESELTIDYTIQTLTVTAGAATLNPYNSTTKTFYPYWQTALSVNTVITITNQTITTLPKVVSLHLSNSAAITSLTFQDDAATPNTITPNGDLDLASGAVNDIAFQYTPNAIIGFVAPKE